MDVYLNAAEVPADFGPSAVTIGKFDGLHIGHRAMIERLRQEASARGLVAAALTFDRNPLSVLRPEVCPRALICNDQKLELLADAGLDATVMLEFSEEFSQLEPDEFVRSILVDTLHASFVLVGGDYRFGRGGAGTVELLQRMGAEHGFETRTIDSVEHDGRRVSSTWVRELLTDGRVAEAAELLQRPPSVRGEVVYGAQRGRELGFPTANLSPELDGFIPADGVYAGWLAVHGDAGTGAGRSPDPQRLPAAISVGNNPTFTGVPDSQVEAHVLGRGLEEGFDLYGKIVEVEFVDRVRGMERFDSIEELTAQIAKDVDQVRSLLHLAAASDD